MITERILQLIDYKGINKSKFYKDTGLSNGFLDKVKDIGVSKLEHILNAYPDVSVEWLISGRGKMLKNPEKYEIDKTLYKSKSIETKDHHENTIPLYDLTPTAGILEIFSDNPLTIPIDHISIPNLPKCDGAMHIRGDSMYPLLKSGDIVAYKTIHDHYNIIWGEMYIVYLSHNGEEYFFCKFLKKSDKDGYVDFISHNQHHQTVSFPAESIKALAMVKASIRFNTLL